MNVIGHFIKIIGWIIFAITGCLGFFLCLRIICNVAGFWGIVAAIILGPITFIAAPIYSGFAWGNWFPLILNYGGGIVGAFLIGLGKTLSTRQSPNLENFSLERFYPKNDPLSK